MKILNIKVSGYKLLKDNFEIDLTTISRVTSIDKESEIIELDDGLYIPTTTVFTGRNASGKSSVLTLLDLAYDLLRTGRVKYNKLLFREIEIQLIIHFYHEGYIYKYEGFITRFDNSLSEESSNCIFKDERIFRRKYAKSAGNKNKDLPFELYNEEPSKVEDTSILYNINNRAVINLFTNSAEYFDSFHLFFLLAESFSISKALVLKITQLFDNGIQEIEYSKEKGEFHIEIKGLDNNNFSKKQAMELLSDGTKKGVSLFLLAIIVLKNGGTLFIDEIENSFNKNLVENLIMIFNDKRINKKGANLMISTHYVEILDIFRRRDNIFIMKKNGYVDAFNLYKDFRNRVDLSKSRQFNNNAFATLLNYEKLMDLKEELMK